MTSNPSEEQRERRRPLCPRASATSANNSRRFWPCAVEHVSGKIIEMAQAICPFVALEPETYFDEAGLDECVANCTCTVDSAAAAVRAGGANEDAGRGARGAARRSEAHTHLESHPPPPRPSCAPPPRRCTLGRASS